MGCSSVWVAHSHLGCSSVGATHSILGQKAMGCSSVWVAHAYLGQTSMNGHELLFSLGYSFHFWSKGQGVLFSVGCSCPFGSNQYEWTWVAFQYGLLKPFWVKIISKGHGLLFSVGCSCPFGSNQYEWTWVTHTILDQTHIKRTWVALQCGLLMPIWVKLA